MCTAATLVTSPIVGWAMAARSAISPGSLMPSSITAASCVASSVKSVIGTPTRLLRLPRVNTVAWPSPVSAAATSSFVVVLPTEPVMQTTGTSKRRR